MAVILIYKYICLMELMLCLAIYSGSGEIEVMGCVERVERSTLWALQCLVIL